MLAEIHEQPRVLRELARRARDEWNQESFLRDVSEAVVIGSGSSFHAALTARWYLESVAGVPTRVDHASEAFRYHVPGRAVTVGLSHSGSSSGVRAALRRARRQGCRTLALTNIEGSPLTRDADGFFVTGAGIERAVPSTKGFTALVAASFLAASRRAGALDSAMAALDRAAGAMEEVARRGIAGDLVELVASAKSVSFLGEGLFHPFARDAALKLLEIAYVPALAYPPEEFLHGPIALAEPDVAVVTLTELPDRIVRAIESSGASWGELSGGDEVPLLVRPLVRMVELQLLAHDVGVRLRRDVDRPRALSKVVR